MHCVDDSRNKYLLYTGNKWKIDKNANIIINKAREKVEKAYDTKIIRGMNKGEMYKIVDTIGNLTDFDKKGRKRIIKELNKNTLVKNDN